MCKPIKLFFQPDEDIDWLFEEVFLLQKLGSDKFLVAHEDIANEHENPLWKLQVLDLDHIIKNMRYDSKKIYPASEQFIIDANKDIQEQIMQQLDEKHKMNLQPTLDITAEDETGKSIFKLYERDMSIDDYISQLRAFKNNKEGNKTYQRIKNWVMKMNNVIIEVEK